MIIVILLFLLKLIFLMMKQCVVPTVKHGGSSVMVWGCFGNNNTGDIVEIDGIMIKEVYLGKKIHSFIFSAIPSESQREPFIFQEDYDPRHSSKLYRII